MKKITVERYECSVCGRLHDEKKDASTCVRSCKKELKEKEQWRLQREELEDIRLTSTSLAEVLIRCNRYLEKYFKVTMDYTSYPDKLRYESITHNSPVGVKTIWDSRNNPDNLPSSYLAFCGRWIGKVKKVTDGVVKTGFSDYIGTFGQKIPFLHTGTGSGGSGFSIDGCMFLQDFPLIEKQHNELVELKLKRDAYSTRETNVKAEYQRAMKDAIDSDAEILELIDVKLELEKKLTMLKEYLDEKITEKTQLYHPNYAHILDITEDYGEQRYHELSSTFKRYKRYAIVEKID
jgi:hypothetical protein